MNAMNNSKPRLIDADLAVDNLRAPENQKWQNKKIPKSAVDWAIHNLDSLPSVKATPIVRARWEFEELSFLETRVCCTNCGFGAQNVDPDSWLRYPGHQYCGSCGAKMILKRKKENPGAFIAAIRE